MQAVNHNPPFKYLVSYVNAYYELSIIKEKSEAFPLNSSSMRIKRKLVGVRKNDVEFSQIILDLIIRNHILNEIKYLKSSPKWGQSETNLY